MKPFGFQSVPCVRTARLVVFALLLLTWAAIAGSSASHADEIIADPSNRAAASGSTSSKPAGESVAAVRRAGSVRFEPARNEQDIPKHFQLAPHEFSFDQRGLSTASRAFKLSTVTFPSPVTTPDVNNNTVHCEYFDPVGDQKRPGVVVLHILGGDFDLARLFCRALAQHGSSALFVKMPYYGPRRQPGSSARMVSLDPRETAQGMTQAVLDIRRAVAWLAAQENVDEKQLGIMGISLGGITGALAATAEPRLQNVCLILAGGDMGQIAWESPLLSKVRERWSAKGETRESLIELLKTVDPVTYGSNVRGRRILMLNALHDEVIPRACTESLWHAFGEPQIIWWEAGHYTAALYMFEGLSKAGRFFRGEAIAGGLRPTE